MSCRENESQNGSNPGKANTAGKRIRWSEKSMTGAIKAVVEGSSISGAAREHGVPRTTLQDRVLGKVTHGTKPGPKRYLNETEEKNYQNSWLKLLLLDMADLEVRSWQLQNPLLRRREL